MRGGWRDAGWRTLRWGTQIRDDPRQKETGAARECQPRGVGLNSSGFTNRMSKHTPAPAPGSAVAGQCRCLEALRYRSAVALDHGARPTTDVASYAARRELF